MSANVTSVVAGGMCVVGGVGVDGSACLQVRDVANTTEWESAGDAVVGGYIGCDSKQESGTSSSRDSVLRLTLGAQGTGATDDRYLCEIIYRGDAGGAPAAGVFLNLWRVVSTVATAVYSDVDISSGITTATVGTRTVDSGFKRLRLRRTVTGSSVDFALDADFGAGYVSVWTGTDTNAARIAAAGQRRFGGQLESIADTIGVRPKLWIDNVFWSQ